MSDLGDLVLQLKLDDDQYRKSLNNAEERARGLKDVPVGLSPDRSFRSVTRDIEQLKRERIRLETQLDTDAAFAKLEQEIQKLERRRIRLNANVTGVEAQLQKIDADISRLEQQRIRIQSDPSATISDLQQIANRIDILDARRIKLNVSRQEAIADINSVETRLNAIEDERVNINITADNARNRIADIDDELDRAAKASNNFGSSFGALQGVIAGASAAIVNNLINIAGRLADIPRQIAAISLSNFRDFDAELQQFSALTGQSRDEMEDLTDEIQRLGVETTKAPTELAALSNELVAIGASKDEVDDLLSSVVALSEATNTGLVPAGSTLLSGSQIFGLDPDQLADDLTTLRNTTATTVTDIDQLISKVGGTFNALGDAADPEELLAYFATLRDGKLPAEEAATGIRGVTASLVDAGKAADLEALGIDAFDDITGDFVGYETVLRQILQTQKELNDPEAFLNLVGAAFGREGIPAITTALTQLDSNFATTFANIQNNSNSAAQSSATLTEGFAGGLKILEGSLETLSIAFGEALAPLVQFFAQGLTQLANQLLTTEGVFDPITQAIENFKASITGSPELLTSITEGIVQLIGLSIDGIAGLFQTLANFFSQPENITAFVQQLQSFVQAIISLGQLAGTIVNITTTFASLFNSISQGVQQVPFLGSSIQALLNPISLLESVAQSLSGIFAGLNLAFAATKPLIETLSSPFEALSNIIDGLIRRVQSLLEQLQEVPSFSGGVNGVVDAAGNFIDAAFKHGGTGIPGKTYLAGEAGPELVKIGDASGLITQPSLIKFDKPGRVYSAPQTKRKLNSGNVKNHSMATQLSRMNKLLSDISEQRGDVNTTVNLAGISPEEMRRELARHQIQVYRGMARRYGY